MFKEYDKYTHQISEDYELSILPQQFLSILGIARKVRETDHLYSVVTNENPSIIGLSRDVIKYKKNSQEIIDFAKKNKIDIAFVSL